MSEAVAQQVLRLSNYIASGFPYYTDVYVPIINTITNNANIILKQSDNTWYTVRSNGGNSTIDRLVIGDALLGTFSETTLTGDTITIVGTVSSSHQHYCQVRWWDSTNIAVFTVDQDSPYALKLYTVNINTGVVTSKGTLIATVDASSSGLQIGVNSTHIYVKTIDTSIGFSQNNYIKKFLKTDLSVENYHMALLFYHTGSTYKTFYFYTSMAVTTNYLWFFNYSTAIDDEDIRLWVSSISNIPKTVCISGNLLHMFSSGKFYYQTDYDGLTVYFTGNNGTGAFYITESDLIKYGAL